MDDLINKSKRADSYRQFSEIEKSKTDRLIDKFCLQAEQELSRFLAKELKCDNSKFLGVKSNLKVDEDTSSISGDFSIEAEILHEGESKVIDIPLKAEKSKLILPTVPVLQSAVKAIQSLQTVASLKIKTEIDDNIAKINEYQESRKLEAQKMLSKSSGIKKEAVSVPHPSTSLAETLKIDKAFMPSGIKVGDVIFIDSAKYRVVNGDEDKLNAEGSGVKWTLNKVLDVLGKDEVVIDAENRF